jgi:hypothetical protein
MIDQAQASYQHNSVFRTSVNFCKLFLAVFVLSSPCPICHGALAQATQQTDTPPLSEQQPVNKTTVAESPSSTLILVIGAAGQAEYHEDFARWAQSWKDLASSQKWNLELIGESSRPAQTTEINNLDEQVAAHSASTDLQRLQAAIERLQPNVIPAVDQANRDSAEQRLWLVFIGHGTAAGKTAKFNLVGPDLAADQLKSWLDRLTRPVIVINCASCSGPFLVELSGNKRIVITATKSGSESNFARFGGYLANAIGDAGADLDHDNEVSLLEAFLKAGNDTDKFYRESSRLATEHALLDDNQDRMGTQASFFNGVVATAKVAQGKTIDGQLARRVILWSSPSAPKFTPDQLLRREQLESAIDQLRLEKGRLTGTDYYQQLEELLLQLAAIYDQVEQP